MSGREQDGLHEMFVKAGGNVCSESKYIGMQLVLSLAVKTTWLVLVKAEN